MSTNIIKFRDQGLSYLEIEIRFFILSLILIFFVILFSFEQKNIHELDDDGKLIEGEFDRYSQRSFRSNTSTVQRTKYHTVSNDYVECTRPAAPTPIPQVATYSSNNNNTNRQQYFRELHSLFFLHIQKLIFLVSSNNNNKKLKKSKLQVTFLLLLLFQ